MNALYIFTILLVSLLPKTDIIYVNNQDSFDKLNKDIKERLDSGVKQITVLFKNGEYQFNESHLNMKGWNYPNASISFEGQNSVIFSKGVDHNASTNSIDSTRPERKCWLDNSLNEISLWSQTYQSPSQIEILDWSTGKCRIESHDAIKDYTYNESKPILVRVTKWYMATTYRVDYIKDSYIYFTAQDLDKKASGGGINLDYSYAKVSPRFRLFSYENLNGNNSHGSIHECVNSCFINLTNAAFKGISIAGFHFLGNASGDSLIEMNFLNSQVTSITDCQFKNIHNNCITLSNTSNVVVENCLFENCQSSAITAWNTTRNIQVSSNRFIRTGIALSNSKVITVSGDHFVVSHNYFEDFCYSAIGIGVWYGDEKKNKCTGVVENNEICYSSEYFNNAWKYTLMDAGAVYTWTKMDDVTIRGNYIHDYTGMKDYRGVFCDDGAQNVKIYGNVIHNIKGSYDIDLRYVPAKDIASKVPDFNMNNHVYGNLMDGYYRYEGIPEKDDNCIHQANFIVGDIEKGRKDSVNYIKNSENDILISGDSSVHLGKKTIKMLKKTGTWNFLKRYKLK